MSIIYSFLVSSALAILFWRLGNRFKIYDQATRDPLKIHKKSVSCLGGAAIFLAFAFFFRDWSIVIAGLVIFLLGFADDLRWRDKSKIRPVYKFIFLVLSSILAGFIVSGSSLVIFLTSLAIFVLINAVNYQDGMDGLAGGEIAVSLIGFMILGAITGNVFIFHISLITLGAVLGFLALNLPPARIFMGDSGSYFLGFILAILVVGSGTLASIFIIGLPLFDGVYTNIRRILKGKSIFLGDREHFYDKLMKRYSIGKTLAISYAVQTMFVLIGLCIFLYHNRI